jgi:hypothetical protein
MAIRKGNNMELTGQDLTTMIRGARLLCEQTLNWRNSMHGPSLEWQVASEENIEAQRVRDLLEAESHRRSVMNGTDFPGHSQR